MDVKPKHAVLIPYRYDGHILIDVVFHLHHRLGLLRDAGDVRERHILVDLLLDGDARGRVVARKLADIERIDFYAAGAEQPLHAITERGIECLPEYRIGSIRGIAACLARL